MDGETRCEAAFDQAVAGLKPRLEAASAVVTRDELRTIRGDQAEVQAIFESLIESALTYRGDRPPRIHAWAFKDEAWWVFAVRDNSARVPPGDATITRTRAAIERRGGRLWDEPNPRGGSTVYFTLPA